jgi:energy-coupling factor transport system ATP-binding protein
MKIVFEHVSFAYPGGVQALEDIDLTIEPGESVALVGENGAGKSTLAKHINGLLKPRAGRVMIGDWDTQAHTPAQLARRVGFVFQNPNEQLFERTVRAEVAFGPKNLGFAAAEVQALVEQALDQMGIAAQAERHPYDLDASQRKLVAIAAALAMQTAVLILDEPTGGQDAAGMGRVAALVEKLKASGRTVLTISHDLDFCAAYFERMVVMAGGCILADGPTAEILAQAELLNQAGVEQPQLVRLAKALEMGAIPRDVEDFLAQYAAHNSR